MDKYPKIQNVFKRDHTTGNLLREEFSLPVFEYLQDNTWIYTEKIDGTNIRIIKDEDGNIEFRGRTDKAQIPPHLLQKLHEIFDEDMKIRMEDAFGDTPVCLYGEGYGQKINKGGKYIKDDVDFILFDIKIGHWWLRQVDMEELAEGLEIPVVPRKGEGTIREIVSVVEKGLESEFGSFPAEGVVAKPKVDLFGRNGQRIITKLKHKDFKR